MKTKHLCRVSGLALLAGLLAFAGVAETMAQRGRGGGRGGGSFSSSSRSHSSVRQSPSRSSMGSRSGAGYSARQAPSRSAGQPQMTRSAQRPTQPQFSQSHYSTQRSGQQVQRSGYGTTGQRQQPGQQPGLGTAGYSQPTGQQAGTRTSGTMTPGQRQTAEDARTRQGIDENRDDARSQRDDNVNQAMQTRDQNVDDALDQRQNVTDQRYDIADRGMSNRTNIADSVTSPGWRWAAGAAVATLPAGCAAVRAGQGTYYYTDGYYLEPVYSGDDVAYTVTAPPSGTVICQSLPSDTSIIELDGITYYVYDNVYYVAAPDQGNGCFQVVDQP